MDHKCTCDQTRGGGFFLGFLLGIVLTLLLTTKKGRELLRNIIDEGLNKFSDLEEVITNEQEKLFEKTDEDGMEEVVDDEDEEEVKIDLKETEKSPEQTVKAEKTDKEVNNPENQEKSTHKDLKNEPHGEVKVKHETQKTSTIRRFFKRK